MSNLDTRNIYFSELTGGIFFSLLLLLYSYHGVPQGLISISKICGKENRRLFQYDVGPLSLIVMEGWYSIAIFLLDRQC